MFAKSLILACAASGLMAGTALAQDRTSVPPDQIQDSPNSPLTVNPVPQGRVTVPARPADSAPIGNLSDTSVTLPANTSLTLETVTNGPVPDTSENRAKYGLPDSNAGKNTAPRGN